MRKNFFQVDNMICYFKSNVIYMNYNVYSTKRSKTTYQYFNRIETWFLVFKTMNNIRPIMTAANGLWCAHTIIANFLNLIRSLCNTIVRDHFI